MGASYYLKCMGYPELRGPDDRPIRFKVRKHLGLLVYMATEGRAQYQRDVLVDLLWGRAPLEDARHSLSTGLSLLRTILGRDTISSSTATVRFTRSALVLDLDRLARAEVLPAGPRPPLEIAAFLADFTIHDSPSFQHWRDRVHAQLLPTIQAGLMALVDHARRSGDIPTLLDLAHRLLAIDPLSEEGVRARMEGYAMSGDRVSALRVFEQWKGELSAQLGALPGATLEGMAVRLRRRGIERPETTVPPVRTEQWAERCFVGRTEEHRALFDAWEATTQFNTRHVMLEGEAGVGKSTLALRFSTAAQLEGAAVARVQCFELEQRIPFGMIGRLVFGLLDRPGVMATSPAALAELARVLPALKERFPNLPPPLTVEGEAARLRFAEGAFALFEAVMEEQPLILIVDDYPRSDEASLSVLHMLLRRTGLERLLVILAARPAEPGEPAQATRIRNGLSYLPMFRITLGPLPEAESDELLSSVVAASGKALKPPERRAILRVARGNPMVLELLAHDWVAHGDAALALALPAMQEDLPPNALEAVAYDQVVQRMLPNLALRTRRALQLATVLGPRLGELEHFRLIGLTDHQTLAALGDLTNARVLRDSGSGLEFTSELLRGRVYVQVSQELRRKLHDLVARRLVAREEAGEKVPGLEIAWHCIRARRLDDATPYLMRGAREAIAHGAPDEAARALSSALDRLKGRDRDEATLLLAETMQEMGEWRDAHYYLEQLKWAARRDIYFREMVAAMLPLVQHNLGQLAPRELNGEIKTALDIVKNAETPGARVRAAVSAAIIANSRPDLSARTAVAEMLQSLAIEGLDSRELGMSSLARALACNVLGNRTKSEENISTGCDILERAKGADSTLVRLRIGAGALKCSWANYANAVPDFEKAHEVARRLDNAILQGIAALNLAICHYRMGDYTEQHRWATTATQRLRSTRGHQSARIKAAAFLGLSAALQKNHADAFTAIELLDAARQTNGIAWLEQLALLYRADIYWFAGRRRAAISSARRALRITPETMNPAAAGPLGRWRATIAIAKRRPSQALGPLEDALKILEGLDYMDQIEVCLATALIQREIGMDGDELEIKARRLLARLPAACARQLQILGLLPPRDRSHAIPEAPL